MRAKLLVTDFLSLVPRPDRAVVAIPAAELASRTHELPAPGRPLILVNDQASDPTGRATEMVSAADLPVAEPGATYRLWRPNPFLEEHLGGAGDALDLGCGSGRDSVFLASEGWRVTAVDHLADAVEMGRDLEARYAPAGAPPIEWICSEFSALSFAAKFNLITLFFATDKALLSQCPNWLAPGGQIMIESFTDTHRERHGKPRSQDKVLSRDDLKRLMPQLEFTLIDEAWRGERHTIRLIGRV
jgi:SAM-dependent methyltransferase